MSKSAILKSSIAKKWWMALTGLFLCLFLVGHLLGNLQLIFIEGVEGKRAFNEYAYFMTHNPLIKIMSYLTYLSILFHAIDGIYITIQNKKARPINYAYNKQGASAKLPSRYMAILGSAILIFIVLHMSAFWGKMHFDEIALHSEQVYQPKQNPLTGEFNDTLYQSYYTSTGSYLSVDEYIVKNGTEIHQNPERQEEVYNNYYESYSIDAPAYESQSSKNPKKAEGYKDLHSLTLAYFGHDKTNEAGIKANEYALLATILYVLAMLVLAFHLWHGFASAFQSLGLKNKKYTPLISGFGMAFSVLIPLAFAIIPIVLFLNR